MAADLPEGAVATNNPDFSGLGFRGFGFMNSGFRGLGVLDLELSSLGCLMASCADAESTQARTLNRMIPPPLALHPRLDCCGFRVSLIFDFAVVFLRVFWTCLDQTPAELGAPWPAGGLLAPELPCSTALGLRSQGLRVWAYNFAKYGSIVYKSHGLGFRVFTVNRKHFHLQALAASPSNAGLGSRADAHFAPQPAGFGSCAP